MGDKLVLDLETQKDFAAVEGRRLELLGVSVCCVYSYEENRYDAYVEADLPKLAPRLQAAELLIGFNIRRFDLPVLQPYLEFPGSTLPMLDIMEEIVKNLGHRLSLDALAQATLGRGKGGSGLDALRWYQEGRMDLITKYCLEDVKLTKELYDYGKQHGRLYYTSRMTNQKQPVPVFWPDRKRDTAAIEKMLGEAFEKRLQVEIEYLSASSAGTPAPAQQARRVDVYYMRPPYFEGYCHLRQDIRQFRIDRILDIKPTWQRYTIPADYVPHAMTE